MCYDISLKAPLLKRPRGVIVSTVDCSTGGYATSPSSASLFNANLCKGDQSAGVGLTACSTFLQSENLKVRDESKVGQPYNTTTSVHVSSSVEAYAWHHRWELLYLHVRYHAIPR